MTPGEGGLEEEMRRFLVRAADSLAEPVLDSAGRAS
jgi:hypothetical protein